MLPKYVVRLSVEEREYLFNVVNAGKGGKEKLNRARILLKADIGEAGESWRDSEIAEALYVGLRTVERTRQSLVEEGLESTINRQLPTVKRKRIIEGDEEAHLIALACSAPPEGNCSWTLRLLADRMVELGYVEAVSHETIREALKKTNLNLGKKKSGAYRLKPMPRSSVKWKKCSTFIKLPTI
jgi:hypothetical protein